jgi:hypothetical protein
MDERSLGQALNGYATNDQVASVQDSVMQHQAQGRGALEMGAEMVLGGIALKSFSNHLYNTNHSAYMLFTWVMWISVILFTLWACSVI